MNFGELSIKQQIGLEERTAFLINYTGVIAQQALNSVEEGLSTRKLYKILANVIIDWHWLSFNYPEKFAFRGIGELVWIPHKYGSLGLVAPRIDYRTGITLHLGLFPNLLELIATRMYRYWGVRGVKETGDERHVLFAPFLPFQALEKSRVQTHERYFWEKLVNIYAVLDDHTLDALASCRNTTSVTHSLWIQFINWKRHMGTALGMVVEEDINHMSEEKKGEVFDNIKIARGCIRQFFLKKKFHDEIHNYINKAKENAALTELQSYIPCIDEPSSIHTQIGPKYPIFIKLSEYISALHGVCGEFRKQVAMKEGVEKPDPIKLGRNLERLKAIVQSPNLVDPSRWFIPFLEPNEREIARLCLKLIDEVFDYFQKELDLPFHRPTQHYKDFLEQCYPLPTDHFTKGY